MAHPIPTTSGTARYLHATLPLNGPPPTADNHEDDDAAFPALPPGVTQILFTPGQAAVLLAVRPSWLRRAAGEGAVPSTLLGKHLRFSLDDLHAAAANGARGRRACS